MRRTHSLNAIGLVFVSALIAFACEPVDDDANTSTNELATKGDPRKGFDYLVNGNYIKCGYPLSVFNVVKAFGQENMSPDWEEQHVEGRSEQNQGLPYHYTHFRTAKGANVVALNCLECHAGHLNGKLVVGLGATDLNFSQDPAAILRKVNPIAKLLLTGENQREWEKLYTRVQDTAGYNVLGTRGPTTASMFTPAILAHQDPVTLKWQHETSFELPPPYELPNDVPPWWNLKKKKAMFYNGSGTGDFTKHMMLASTFCIDGVDEAKEINSHFADVQAFIETIQPPKYPFAIDSAKAARGETVFQNTCSGCHGTYGPNETYPNKLIPLAVIKTDPGIANQVSARPPALAWHEKSYYGEGAPWVPNQGYVAPPLNGVWATAPYLHNGSVPTLRALLDSKSRPTYWARTFHSTDYDSTNVGWKFAAKDRGKDAFSGSDRVNLYDTTLPGFNNTGHTFGDALSDADRDDVIEYLKTL